VPARAQPVHARAPTLASHTCARAHNKRVRARAHPHLCPPHTHSRTLTHTHTRAHTPSRTRANTPTHTRSGSRDPRLGSRGSCLRLHRSGPLDRPVENAVPALARTATRQAPTSGPQLLNRS